MYFSVSQLYPWELRENETGHTPPSTPQYLLFFEILGTDRLHQYETENGTAYRCSTNERRTSVSSNRDAEYFSYVALVSKDLLIRNYFILDQIQEQFTVLE